MRVKQSGGASVLEDLRVSGALKLLFPRGPNFEAVSLNVSGGLTGGDRFAFTAEAGPGSHLTFTTQAAERAYRSAAGMAEVSTRLKAEQGSRINWLPQETILFETCAVRRKLRVDLAAGAEYLMVEPLVFGRHAMGERLHSGHLDDEIDIRRDGRPLYKDRLLLSGDIDATLARGAVGQGAGAMANVVFASDTAEAQLQPLRALLPETGGASLRAPDLLVLRILAQDGYDLRQSLLPVLDHLTHNSLPKSWRF